MFRFETLANGWTVGRFAALEGAAGIAHVVTTRRGPDVLGRASSTAAAVASVLGLEGAAWLRQVHGCAVRTAERGGLVGRGDALVARVPRLGLMVQGADCPLILLWDRRGGVCAAVHASWRGTVGRVTAAAVAAMGERFGARPGDVVACICPSAGPCCYEVGQDVRRAALAGVGPHAERFFERREGKTYFDLWSANTDQLLRAGVGAGNIHCARVCTICRNDLLPSYRVEGDRAGRFVAVIGRT